MGLQKFTRYSATLALCFYFLFEHSVLAAAVPILMITVCIIDGAGKSNKIIEFVAYVVTLILSLVLPRDDQLFGPVASYAMLMLTTTITVDDKLDQKYLSSYVVALSMFATSVAAFAENYGAVAIVSMSGSAISATSCIARGGSAMTGFSSIATVLFYPLLGIILYEWLAVSSDPAPVPLVAGTAVTLSLALLS